MYIKIRVMAVRYIFLTKTICFLLKVSDISQTDRHTEKTLMFLYYVLADLKDESRKILQIRGQIEIEIVFLGSELRGNSNVWS